jgi:5-methylcytosine-specific restriction endonuclease McrA
MPDASPRLDHALKFETLWPKRQDGLCRCGCGATLEGKRRSWASPECEKKAAEEFKFRKGYGETIRARLKARDRGVCSRCGLDTEEARRACVYWWDYKTSGPLPDNGTPEHLAAVERMDQARRKYMRLGFPEPSRTWWEAHHIKPLVEGGAHTMENLATVCVACHKAETAALAKRRAERRKPVAKLPPLISF